MNSFPSVIWAPQDSFDLDASQLNGRRFVGGSFIDGIVSELQTGELLHLSCPQIEGKENLGRRLSMAIKTKTMAKIYSEMPRHIIEEVGSLHTLDPSINELALSRRGATRELRFSVTGIIHSLSSKNAIFKIASCVGGDTYPWDALICSSTAGRDVVRKIWEQRLEYLSRRFSSERLNDQWLPSTPVIPLLGPSTQPYHPEMGREERRMLARSVLGISARSFVVITLGRISFHSKANPIPLYKALSDIALKNSDITLIECGQYANDGTEHVYNELAALYPAFKRLVIGGGVVATELEKWQALAAANVYVSVSDNIQETFGISLLEAMLAELPVIASDWSGYRDIVQDGVTGFLVPTSNMLDSLGRDPLEIAYYSDNLSYDFWIGLSSLGISVDIGSLERLLHLLMTEDQLCSRLGQKGFESYHKRYTPNIVINQYRHLWSELSEMRKMAISSGQYTTGRAPVMQQLFSGFSTTSEQRDSARIVDVASAGKLLSSKLTKEFLALLTGGDLEKVILGYIENNTNIEAVELCNKGLRHDQAIRLISILVKYGVAV